MSKQQTIRSGSGAGVDMSPWGDSEDPTKHLRGNRSAGSGPGLAGGGTNGSMCVQTLLKTRCGMEKGAGIFTL